MLLSVPAAAAEIDGLVAQARDASRQCRAGDLAATSAELEALLASLERQLGRGHALSQRVRLTLARVERERGDSRRAAQLEAPLPGDATSVERSDLRSLDRALKKLRSCPPRRQKPRQLAAASFEDELAAARLQLLAGRYLDATPHAERAYQLAVEQKDPQRRLDAAEALAQVRLLSGDPRALEASRAAEKAAREAGALESRIAIARLLARSGDLDGAAQSLEQLGELARDAVLIAELMEARGELALLLGSPREALVQLERATLGHRAQGLPKPSLAAVLQLVGDAQRAAGNYPAAAAAYAEAHELRVAAYGATHPETARTRNAIGVLYSDFGNYSQARSEFEGAGEIFAKSLGPEHPETQLAAVNAALARWSERRDEASARRYEHAVDSWATALGGSHPNVAEAQRNLAWMKIELGDGEGAEALLEKALLAQTARYGERHPSVALTRLARGRLLLRRGKAKAAQAEIEKALAFQVAAFGPDHPSVARARLALSRAATAGGDPALAWLEAREAARILDLHMRRAFGAMTDRERMLFADQARDAVGALLSVDGAPETELLAALLPHRDSVIRSIAGRRARARESDPRMRVLLDELGALRARYAAASLSSSADTALRARELAMRIDELETRAALAGVARDEPDPQRLLFRACQRLPRDALLIEFVAYERTRVGGGEPLPSYAAMLLRSDCTVEKIELGAATTIDDAAERFARAMRDQISDEPQARADLASALLGPLRSALAASARWLVIPDGSLWGVPFAALPDPERPGRYLLERVTVGYLTSIHELAESDRKPYAGAVRRSLLFGAPDFGSGEAKRGPIVWSASGPCALPPFEPLPGTRREIEEIGAMLPEARSITGAEATKSRLLLELASKPQVLHLATHAYFAGASECESGPGAESSPIAVASRIAPNPLLLSGIAFAGANGSDELAGAGAESTSAILTAYESSGLDLRETRLVVLSACDTGTGLQQHGQEVQGLRWGFRAAGARALVTSLWRSNDRATRQLMLRMYQALESEALPKDVFAGAEALRTAQLERVKSDMRLGLLRPLLWSNFVFSGVL